MKVSEDVSAKGKKGERERERRRRRRRKEILNISAQIANATAITSEKGRKRQMV